MRAAPPAAQRVREFAGGLAGPQPLLGCSEREQPGVFWAQDAGKVAAQLGVEMGQGLSDAEASERLVRHGANELLERPPPSALVRFLKQFTDIAVVALMVAALIAVVLGWNEKAGDTFLHRFGDAIAIGIIVLLNAVIGFAQERKAERALRALKQLGAPIAKVIRGGTVRRIPARELVPGDLVEIAEGDRIPADARLAETSDLIVSESALTGESAPVDKLETGELSADTPLAERANMVFMGTHVAGGRARAIVTASGMKTELGHIATMLGEVEVSDTPLQKSLQRFGTLVVAGCAVLAVFVFVVGWIRLEASLGFLLLTAVSLAVAAIPEGLPAVTTIVLALGVQRMARNNALVRRLAAVETLGSADVICSDKTGTLTQNKMVVRRLLAAGRCLEVEQGPDEVLRLKDAERGEVSAGTLPAALVCACRTAPAAALPDDGGSPRGDPTDAALIRLASRLSRPQRDLDEFETIRTVPFDRERKMATVIVSDGEEVRSYSHGAPEAVLGGVTTLLDASGAVRPLESLDREALGATVDEWAARGLRVIALAQSGASRISLEQASRLDRDALVELAEREMTFVGMVGIADPPRPEAKRAIARARAAGVRTLMITGDHPLTAEAIAKEMGILSDGGEVVTGPQVDSLSPDELAARIDGVRVVARATAANKLRLVEALKARGHVVAMTGDGINDAPAIKAASIGVAMGRGGTDVTREAADMVLLDDNYATIVRAIEEGRIVYGNIKRFIVFLFAVNAGLVLAVLYGAAAGWPPILTPTQILWINLITNGLPALALGMEPVHLDPMNRPPRSADERLVSSSELLWLSGYGALMAMLGIATFAALHDPAVPGSLTLARTATFTVLALAPLFHAFSSRSRKDSLFTLGVFSNRWLVGAFAFAFGLQAIAVYGAVVQDVFSTTALGPRYALAAIGVSSLVWVCAELEKAAMRLVRRRRNVPITH